MTDAGHKTRRGVVAGIVAVVALVGMGPAAIAENQNVEGRKAGGGMSVGTMTYVGTPLPKLAEVCKRGLAFTLGNGDDPDGGWTSEAFAFRTAGAAYAGPVRITGGGNSDTSCESFSLGGGILTVELLGVNPVTGGTLHCGDVGDPATSTPLRGRYVRVLSELEGVITGRCTVDGLPTGQVSFLVRVQAVPGRLDTGEGITEAVRSMTTAGAFVLVPA